MPSYRGSGYVNGVLGLVKRLVRKIEHQRHQAHGKTRKRSIGGGRGNLELTPSRSACTFSTLGDRKSGKAARLVSAFTWHICA